MSAQPDGRTHVRRVAASIEEILGPGAHREPFVHGDGKSGVRMERVVVDGQRYVLKHLHVADDWIMRATGDLAGRPITLWRRGLLDRLPDCFDHATVGAAWDDRPEGRGAVVVMRDVGEWLLPEGDVEIPLDAHLAFVDHMARLHTTFWGFRDTVGLLPLSQRYVWFGPHLADVERARGSTAAVPTRLVPQGWDRFAERAPDAAPVVLALLEDASPLVRGLASTPATLLHGDWKAGNLGRDLDGRTILLDWAVTGAGPPCAEIAHYVCLNRARLPQSKDATLRAYREALERHGMDTGPWWDRQCALSLLGTLLMFGWEKAWGEDEGALEDLAWWRARALDGAREL
ncbi:aminoglycoside phosphotransferase [Egibacter rhizosphaerae]|uniref:Aminoglycoside phosphotransferase n=1 Tax=Egibacter rhizosphaerae TaxID=1670831 RepID=A0A411YAF7_9ACTN|nr:phosphotransferase [Egibacter rhizosphaerae]QBI18186.1 aminoglycoside phosphotransferase [Egibacter rhizosphaerae]